LREQENEATVG